LIRVVLADDHNLVRGGIRALLEELPDVQVVAEAADGRDAVARIAEHRPDVALLDIAMPGLNGLEAAARIGRETPGTRVVILSMHSAPGYVAQALAAGVAGSVLKDAFVDELPLLIRAVSQGISRQVVDALRSKMAPVDPTGGALTDRQREVLQLLAEGMNTKEIAHLLGVSAKTVESHRTQLMERLDIHDLAGLVRYAIRIGLVSPER
jgi:DNA-binding NarL/FixJ family response regulator